MTIEIGTPPIPFDAGRLGPLADQFRTGQPFPHVTIPGFLTLSPDQLAPSFPDPEWPGWTRFRDTYQHQKMFCNDLALIPAPLATIIQQLSAPAFLKALEMLTRIPALIPDPYLEGGGLHSSGPGGILAPHTDFHHYRRLALHRRINLLLYLNPEWSEDDGGCLELYEAGRMVPVVTIVPTWGTCVVFETDDRSVHGFFRPIRPGRWRHSIALYYYTSAETRDFSGDASTHWRSHAPASGLGRLRLPLYKTLIFGSKCLSRLAHGVNPHMGSRPLSARDDR
jgi:hypothetical protein